MMAKLKNGVLAMGLLILLGLIAWQRREIKLLRTEGNDLRGQLAQSALLQEENERSAQQFKKSVEDSQTDHQELVRLRGQLSRLHQLEQENLQLKAERTPTTAEQRAQSSPVVPPAVPQRQAVPTQAPGGVSAEDVKDFGVVEFSDGVPQPMVLGADKECLITATKLADGNLRMAFSSTSEIDGVPIQTERTLTQAPGAQFATVIDGVDVTLTPTLKAN